MLTEMIFQTRMFKNGNATNATYSLLTIYLLPLLLANLKKYITQCLLDSQAQELEEGLRFSFSEDQRFLP